MWYFRFSSERVYPEGAKPARCLNLYVVFSVWMQTSLPTGKQIHDPISPLRELQSGWALRGSRALRGGRALRGDMALRKSVDTNLRNHGNCFRNNADTL